MKNFLIQISCIIACILILAGCRQGPDRDIDYNIYVTHGTLNMVEGDEIQITASPTDQTFTWSSADPSVVTVSSTGLVKALKEGVSAINITSSEGLQRAIPVDVAKFLPLEGIDVFDVNNLSPVTSLSLSLDQSITLGATPSPRNYNEKIPFNIIWRSTDENIAIINENGMITPVEFGNASIIVSSVEKPSVQATIPIAIVENPITEIQVPSTTLDLILYEIVTITPALIPTNYSVKDASLNWVSSDPAVVTVSDGRLEVLEIGSATITVSLNSNPSVKTDIFVNIATPPVVNVDISTFVEDGAPANTVRSKIRFERGCIIDVAGLSAAEIEASYNRDFMAYDPAKNRLVFLGNSNEYDILYSEVYSYFYIFREQDVAPATYWITGSGHWLSPVPYPGQPGEWNMGNFLRTGYFRLLGNGRYQITVYLVNGYDIQIYSNRSWGGVLNYPITGGIPGIAYHSNGVDIVDSGGFVPGTYRITVDIPGETIHFAHF